MANCEARRGVVYKSVDYVGFWRRAAISILDITVIVMATIILSSLLTFLPVFASGLDNDPTFDLLAFGLLLLIGFVYLVILKRSSQRTLGYRVFRARIVNLYGERPTIWQMIQRFAFLVAGPVNFAIDLFWITNEDTRQALRAR